MSDKNKVDDPQKIGRHLKNANKENDEFFEDNTIDTDNYCTINGAKIEGNACSTIRNNLGKDV
jgi:hypothetical protein